MKFSDEGIIISTKNYGENSLIVKIFSRDHGVYRSFVRGAKSKKTNTIYQVGNLVSFEFRSRIEDNLGSFFSVNPISSYCSRIMFDQFRLNCVRSLFSMLDTLFLEQENHADFFAQLLSFMQKISAESSDKKDVIADYVRLELEMLRELGYGIDLSSCVVTNATTNLAYVSPKSGHAVSISAAASYENKLLKLPNFLTKELGDFDSQNLLDGLNLSGFFLQKFLSSDQQKFPHREEIKKDLGKSLI
ncbi:MAG: DNA repair protein RecO [Proteobacteria bacterium]|nr:DNA repair protein RecO [Pseudomonadota bacterium]